MPSSRGFTLIEVLIALAIVAIGLSAALRASSVGTDGVGQYRQRLLAGWLADNVASERSARGDWPDPGDSSREETLAGVRFQVRESVKATPNPRFRRLDIEVAAADAPDYALRRLAIFLTVR
jgi:general secretion pathway protein I